GGAAGGDSGEPGGPRARGRPRGRCAVRSDSSGEPERAVPDIVIITGMSGAGRSTAAKSLEDLDWFVADNLPPDLLPTMLDLARRAQSAVPRLAAGRRRRRPAVSTRLKAVIGDPGNRGSRPFL